MSRMGLTRTIVTAPPLDTITPLGRRCWQPRWGGSKWFGSFHTVDWQLGMTRHFLSGDAQSRYSEARLEAVRAIGRLATAEQCKFVIVAGDVFESNQVARNIVLPALEAMAECTVPVLLLPGNHDALTAGSVYRTKAFVDNKPANVTVLEASEVIELDSIRIVPATWQTRKPDVNPAETACRELTTGAGAQVLVGARCRRR